MADKEKKQSKSFSLKVAVFILLVVLAIFFPTTVLLCGCMMPTLVVAIVDDKPGRTGWLTVGAMNLAGVIPSWFELWDMGHRIDQALALLMQPRTLMIAYGAAAVGWFLYVYIPPFIAAIMARRADKRLRDIGKRQKELVRKWGDEVAG